MLRRELKEIQSERTVQTAGRSGTYRVALVGYTNAGKSTLMNAITGATVYVKDQLFATLDATTRRVEIDERRNFLLTDTVGFIRRLPHHLVESFRATLQEVADADLLLHVVDAGSAEPEQQMTSVQRVLYDLGVGDKPTQLVFNKLDTVVAPELFRNGYDRHHPGALFVSALSPDGAAAVSAAIVARMRQQEHVFHLRMPASRVYLLGSWHRTGDVLEQDYQDGTCSLAVRMREEDYQRLLSQHRDIQEVIGS